MPKVKTKDLFCKDIFKKGPVIPSFQRDAAWNENKVVVLWESITEFVSTPYSADPTYHFYIGNIVTLDSHREIVDGQQRLNAITTIACALRDVLIRLGKLNLAHELHNAIIQDQRGKFRYTLNEKYVTSVAALKSITSPRVRFYSGYTVHSVTLNNSSGGNKVLEIGLRGKATWTGYKGILHSEDGIELNNSTTWRQGQNHLTIEAKMPDTFDENELVGKKLMHGVEPQKLDFGHEFCRAYLMIGGLFEHHFSDIELKTDFTKKKIKVGKNSIALKMDNEWLTPCGFLSGDDIEITHEDNTRTTLTQTSDARAMTNVFNINHESGTEFQLKSGTAVLPRNNQLSNINPGLASAAVLMETYVRVIQNIKFAVTNFTLYSNALEHFTITNDGTRREPLFNYDLLHAHTYHIVDQLSNSHQTTSDEVKSIWETKIVDSILPARESRRDALRKSNEFFGRYCLSKNYVPDASSRYKWEISNTSKPNSEIFSRLVTEMKNNPTFYSGPNPLIGIKDLYNEFARYAKYHVIMLDPIQQQELDAGTDDDKFLTHKARALIYTIRSGDFDFFVPLMMSILDRLKGESVEDRSDIVIKTCERILYYILRYWIYANECRNHESDTMKLKAGDFYGMYTGPDGWSTKITDTANTAISEIPEVVENQFKSWVTKQKENGMKDTEWPIPQDKRNYDIDNDNHLRVILFAYQYCNTPTPKFGDLFLRPKTYTDTSNQPELEHILPNTDKTSEDWWDWKSFKTIKTHRENKQKLGNRCLLEWHLNRSWHKKQKFASKFPKGYTTTTKCIQNSDYFSFQFPGGAVTSWTKNRIKKRSEAIWEKLCTKFVES